MKKIRGTYKNMDLTKVVTFRLDREDYDTLKKISVKQRESMSDILRNIIYDNLKRRGRLTV